MGLTALAWISGDADRVGRFLALTGLSPTELRDRAAEPALLAAALTFLEAREADLVACAEAIATAPEALSAARVALEAE